MHWSRSAAVVSLSLLLFVPPAVAQTQAPAASGGAFKDACKAGYTYLVVPSASGVSVSEAQKVNCAQKDGNGLLVNLYVRECWERIGDIYWDCRNALPAGTYKCEHKTCNEGEAISAPTANTFSAPMAASPREELQRVLTPGPEVRTAPLPPLSGKSIFDAFQETPTNTERERCGRAQRRHRSRRADNSGADFERSRRHGRRKHVLGASNYRLRCGISSTILHKPDVGMLGFKYVEQRTDRKDF